MKNLFAKSVCLLLLLTASYGRAQTLVPSAILVGTNNLQVIFKGAITVNKPVSAILQNAKGQQGTALFMLSSTLTRASIYINGGTNYSYTLSKTATNLVKLKALPVYTGTNGNDNLELTSAKASVRAMALKVKGSYDSTPASSNNPVTVDVLILYTPGAASYSGGASNVQATANLAVAEANQTYANSGVFVTLRLVGVAPLAQTETTSLANDLGTLTANTTAQSLREQYAADVVTLFENDLDPYYSGMAWQLTDTSDQAYNVVGVQYAYGYFVYPHEVSHNFGCAHDVGNAGSAGAYTYSYGYRFVAASQTYRTVMAYPPGFQIGYFSNPNVSFLGTPTGNANADNATTLNQRAGLVASFRMAPTNTITINLNGSGSVTYNGNPAPATLSLVRGQTATLVATGNFLCWSGAYTSSSNTIQIVSSTNTTITANFSDGTQPFAPFVTQNPAAQNVPNGGTIQLSCQGFGIPTPVFVWQLNGTSINRTGTNLTLTAAVKAQQGNYTCLVSNSAGSVVSAIAGVTVGAPATIVQQPVSTLAEYGGAAGFSVLLDTANFNYQWYFNGGTLAGATNATLLFTNVQPANMGNYYVKASLGTITLTSSVVQLYLASPPTISQQPSSQVVVIKSNVVFASSAVGLAPLYYQWQFNNQNMAGQTGASLNLTAVQASQAGTYQVLISNPNGITTSTGAVLTVLNPLVIQQQPVNLTGLVGTTPTFSVTAGGTQPITYQWYKSGVSLSNQVYSTCRLQNVATNQAGTYYVVISNPAGSIQSTNVTLTVLNPPVITQAPAGLSANEGASASFSVVATGKQPFSYQWFNFSTAISGATSASYTINPVTPSSAGYYSVTVANSDGQVNSGSVALNVSTHPIITSAQQTTTTTIGSSAGFSVSATGLTPMTYQWFLNGNPVAGATNSTINLINVQTNQAGSYTVTVQNSIGSSTSAANTLTVLNPPVIVLQASAVVDQNSTLNLSPTITGKTPITYSWKFNNATLTGKTSAVLSVSNMQATNAGNYSLTAANADGTVSASVSVGVFTSPVIITQPQSVTNANGANATFSANAAGGSPLSYQWFFGSNVITGATANVLSLTNINLANIGTYYMVVSNRLGITNTLMVNLGVSYPPVITTQPQSSAINVGSSASFNVIASGKAPLTYQWYLNGTAIGGATTSTYTVTGATINSAGTYMVKLTNPDGAVSSQGASLTVIAPPTIITQPIDLVVNRGQAASFTAAVSSQAAVTFQWYYNSAVITGATSATLALSNIQLTQQGSYQLTVNNSAGSISSRVANLRVKDPAYFIQYPSSCSVNYGNTLNLSCLATSSITPISYQWYQGAVSLANQTNAQLSIPNVTASFAGNYWVKAWNTDGTNNSSIATVTYAALPPVIGANLPSTLMIIPNATLQLAVSATGSAPLTYQWRYNGSNILNQITNSLTIPNIQTNNAGNYQVIVSNPDGSAGSFSCALTVIAQAPVFSVQPVNVIVAQGGTATLSATCSNPAGVSYQWFKNGNAITGATSSTLTINNVQNSDVASYYIQGSNPFGSTLSGTAAIQIVSPPIVIAQPQSVLVAPNAMAQFNVSATGGGTLSYQWYYNGTAVGGNSSSYIINSVNANNTGNYYVQISNLGGTIASSTAVLTMQQPPSITSQPAGITNQAGINYTLSVGVTGRAPLSYQWYWFTNALPGANQSSLVLNTVQPTASGTYYVNISNPDGVTNSFAASILITNVYVIPASNLPPVIVTQPQSFWLGIGASVNLYVVATNAATYQWLFNGNPIIGATLTNLALTNLQPGNAGYYSVQVGNANATITSASVAGYVRNPPVITQQPVAVTNVQGTTATFSITASGGTAFSPLLYQWYKFGYPVVPIVGATNATLILPNVQANGAYLVLVKNSDGSLYSSYGGLTVLTPPTFTSTTMSIRPNIGSGFSLNGLYSGTQPCTIQWSKDGINIPGATNSFYAVTACQITNDGVYSFSVTNMLGGFTAAAYVVHVYAPPTIQVPLPGVQYLLPGVTVTFTVPISGRIPMTYQWYYNNAPIVGATNASYTVSSFQTNNAGSYYLSAQNQDGMVNTTYEYLTMITPPSIAYQPQTQGAPVGSKVSLFVVANSLVPMTYQWYQDGILIPGAVNSTLNITNIQLESQGNYTVTIQNTAGSITSAPATLTVTYPPSILYSPSSQTVAQGGQLNLSVIATGSQPMTFTWYLNGSVLVGPNTSSLLVQNIQTNQAGSYYVVVSNTVGKATSTPAYVSVVPLPIITQQPQVTIVTVSNAFSLFVGAKGTGLSYQWFKDGAILTGATANSYGNTNAQYSDAGTYTVNVANSYGTVPSQPAVVLVLPTQPDLRPSNPGQPILLQIVSTLNDNITLVYYGAVGSNYVIQATSDMKTWTTLTNITPVQKLNQYTDIHAAEYGSRFYQIRLSK